MTASRDWNRERAAIEAHAGLQRIALIAQSFARVTGGELVPPGTEPGVDEARALWSLPGVVVAHGTEADPVFFYANRAALELFEMAAAEFVHLPSRLSAEPLEREERARIMERVTRENFIADYAGVRVSASGRRFRIEQATVWNLIDAAGALGGQAATFECWESLES